MVVYKLSDKIDPFDLPAELQQKANKELNEDLSTRAQKIQELRNLIKKESEEKSSLSDEFLLRFLRVRKYAIDAAYSNIKNYIKTRKDNPSFFIQDNPVECDRYWKEQYADILPETDVDGCIVHINLFGSWDVEDFDLDEIIKGFTSICEYAQRNPLAQINGVRVICDVGGFGLQHLQQYTPAKIKLCTGLIQECFPIRFKGFHILNESAVYGKLYALMKPLLKAKIANRFHLHGGDLEALSKYVPKEKLPEDIKGGAPPMNNKPTRETLYGDDGLIQELKQLCLVK